MRIRLNHRAAISLIGLLASIVLVAAIVIILIIFILALINWTDTIKENKDRLYTNDLVNLPARTITSLPIASVVNDQPTYELPSMDALHDYLETVGTWEIWWSEKADDLGEKTKNPPLHADQEAMRQILWKLVRASVQTNGSGFYRSVRIDDAANSTLNR